MKRQIVVIFAVATLFAGFAQTASSQDESQKFVGEATVNVIEVPVQVIDKTTGEPVLGLSPVDFRVRESGVEQRISNFTEISEQRAVAAADGGEGGVLAAVTDDEISKPLQVVFFFDLYLMFKGDRDRAIAGLEEHYRSGIPDGEQVSVVAFDGELETFLDRSDDRDDLLDAVDELRYVSAHGINQMLSFSEDLTEGPVSGERDSEFYERRQRSREYVYELEKRSTRVGNAILASMARYARAEGRRVLVAFTPGQPRSNWSPTYYSIDFLNAEVAYPTEDMWNQIAREAANLGFTLYTMDTSGLRTGGALDAEAGLADSDYLNFGGGEQRDGREGAVVAVDPSGPGADFSTENPNEPTNLGQWMERNRKNQLVQAAKATGGSALFSGNVAEGMAVVKDAVGHYYSLAYTADHVGDGKTYEIEVEVPGHPDYRVVHRTAYVDQPASTRAAQRLRSEMLFGGDANPLGVRVQVGELDSKFRLGATGSKRIKVPLEIQIPFARIEMIPRGDVYWGKVLITFFGEDDAGNQSELSSHEQPITVESARYQEAVAKGYFSYKTTVMVEGGEQNIYVGIEDLIGGKTSIMPQEFSF